MKRFVAIFLLLACVIAVTACQAAPTAEPTSATTAESPTAQPTGTAQPSPTPFNVVDSVGAYQSESFCDNPYMPLRKGSRWALSTIDIVMSMEVSDVTKTDSESVAQMKRSYDFGESYDMVWRCTADGMFNFDITSYSSENGLVLPVALVEHSGYYLPNAEKLVQGYTWTEHTIAINQGYTLTTDLNYEVISVNPVQVLGQDVPGLQVHVTGKMTAVDEAGKENSRNLDYIREFGLGIGLVREDQLLLRKLSVVQ